MFKLKLPAFALAAAGLLCAPAALATPITYNFTVTMPAGQGPMGGTVTNGSFTYDSSSVVPGGANNATGLLTALNFTWDGITYNRTTANTGELDFDTSGDLVNFAFGTNCVPGTCGVTSGSEQWWAVPSLFAYSSPGNSTFEGSLTFSLAGASVPEPGNLALFAGGLLLALGGFSVLRRRRPA